MNKFLIGVSTLLAVGIGARFVYNKRKQVKHLSRQLVLNTAKIMRQEMFLIFVEISCFVKQNASKIPPNQLRQYVLDGQSSFMKNMHQKLSKIFTLFTQEQYQQNVQKYYKEDIQIQYHLKRYQQQFDRAVLGVQPQFKEQIITFISKQKLLILTKQLLQSKMKRLTQGIKQKIKFQQMVVILRSQKEQQKRYRSEKLKQLGLVGKDEELTKIYQFTVAKYCKMSQEFKLQYQQLIQQYRVKMNQHVDRFCTFPRSTSKKNIGERNK